MTPDEAKDEVTFWTAEVALLNKAQTQAENDLYEVEAELHHALSELAEATKRVQDL